MVSQRKGATGQQRVTRGQRPAQPRQQPPAPAVLRAPWQSSDVAYVTQRQKRLTSARGRAEYRACRSSGLSCDVVYLGSAPFPACELAAISSRGISAPGSSRDDCDSSDRSVPIHFPDFGARRGGRAQSHLTLWSQLALSVAVLTVVVGTVPPTCAASVGTPVRSSVRHSLLPQATRDRSPGASSARPCRRGPPEP